MNIFTNLKDKLKNIPLIHFGKAEPVKPANPPIDSPRPVEYDK